MWGGMFKSMAEMSSWAKVVNIGVDNKEGAAKEGAGAEANKEGGGFSIPGMPAMPSMEGLPKMPSMPEGMPKLPKLPDLPSPFAEKK